MDEVCVSLVDGLSLINAEAVIFVVSLVESEAWGVVWIPLVITLLNRMSDYGVLSRINVIRSYLIAGRSLRFEITQVVVI